MQLGLHWIVEPSLSVHMLYMLKILGQSYFHMYMSFVIHFNEDFGYGACSKCKKNIAA